MWTVLQLEAEKGEMLRAGVSPWELWVVSTAVCATCHCFPQVLVTVPLAMLQRGAIQFNPPLSEKKMKAINSLGAGIIEKVT